MADCLRLVELGRRNIEPSFLSVLIGKSAPKRITAWRNVD